MNGARTSQSTRAEQVPMHNHECEQHEEGRPTAPQFTWGYWTRTVLGEGFEGALADVWHAQTHRQAATDCNGKGLEADREPVQTFCQDSGLQIIQSRNQDNHIRRVVIPMQRDWICHVSNLQVSKL